MVNIRFSCGDFCILVGHVGFVIYVSDQHGARRFWGLRRLLLVDMRCFECAFGGLRILCDFKSDLLL
jgi:hypothetical protein